MTKDESVDRIIACCQDHDITQPEQIAYVLATVQHETGGTFLPVEEGYYLKDPKKFQKTLRYYPFYGRGFVQITWKANYQKFTKLVGVNLVLEPDKALDYDIALFILCYGFKHGSFTGKKLEDYIRPRHTDFIGARRCINGTDCAAKISGYAYRWLKQLKETS